ncbi:unnamed protein product [Caenorhabditis nigoni]
MILLLEEAVLARRGLKAGDVVWAGKRTPTDGSWNTLDSPTQLVRRRSKISSHFTSGTTSLASMTKTLQRRSYPTYGSIQQGMGIHGPQHHSTSLFFKFLSKTEPG